MGMKVDKHGNVLDPNAHGCLDFIGWTLIGLFVILCLVGLVVSLLYVFALLVVG